MTTPKIYQQISKVMGEVEPVAKLRKNTAQNYAFRGIDDIYQALSAILAKHEVFTTGQIIEAKTETRATKTGGELTYRILHIRWRFYTVDGSFIESDTIGEGMDSGDKASNKAMSVAHKYALIQVFAIPTAEAKDPENDSYEPKLLPAAPKLPTPAAPSVPHDTAAPIITRLTSIPLYQGGEAHRKRIGEKLEAKGLLGIEEAVHKAMLGRPLTDFEKVIKEVCK